MPVRRIPSLTLGAGRRFQPRASARGLTDHQMSKVQGQVVNLPGPCSQLGKADVPNHPLAEPRPQGAGYHRIAPPTSEPPRPPPRVPSPPPPTSPAPPTPDTAANALGFLRCDYRQPRSPAQ